MAQQTTEIDKLLTEGYRCALWGRRIYLCNGELCHLKSQCIFMNGSPENYVNYVLKEFVTVEAGE